MTGPSLARRSATSRWKISSVYTGFHKRCWYGSVKDARTDRLPASDNLAASSSDQGLVNDSKLGLDQIGQERIDLDRHWFDAQELASERHCSRTCAGVEARLHWPFKRSGSFDDGALNQLRDKCLLKAPPILEGQWFGASVGADHDRCPSFRPLFETDMGAMIERSGQHNPPCSSEFDLGAVNLLSTASAKSHNEIKLSAFRPYVTALRHAFTVRLRICRAHC